MEAARPDLDCRCYWVRGGAGERTVRSAAEALELLRGSQRLRHTASHALNEASSRSHCIFSLGFRRRRHVHKLVQAVRTTAARTRDATTLDPPGAALG